MTDKEAPQSAVVGATAAASPARPAPAVPEAKKKYPVSAQVGELLFTLLPLIVLAFVLRYKGTSWLDLLASPEWAFAASVLFGQTVVKFVTGLLSIGKRPIVERVGLFVSLFIVVGLVPSLIVLALLLVSATPPLWLVVAQLVLFVAGATSFVLFGALTND